MKRSELLVIAERLRALMKHPFRLKRYWGEGYEIKRVEVPAMLLTEYWEDMQEHFKQDHACPGISDGLEMARQLELLFTELTKEVQRLESSLSDRSSESKGGLRSISSYELPELEDFVETKDEQQKIEPEEETEEEKEPEEEVSADEFFAEVGQ